MKTSERKIIELTQNGQLDQFNIIYEKYVKKIYNFTYYKTMSKETAEDLTSQTFLKALRKIDQFKLDGSFSAWLYQIARNNVIDHYRSQKPESNIEDAWDLSSDTDIENDLDVQQDLNTAKEYLQKLDSNQREIAMLRLWEQMSYQEIAQITGKTETNCRMIFSRTMSKMRKEVIIAILSILLIS